MYAAELASGGCQPTGPLNRHYALDLWESPAGLRQPLACWAPITSGPLIFDPMAGNYKGVRGNVSAMAACRHSEKSGMRVINEARRGSANTRTRLT